MTDPMPVAGEVLPLVRTLGTLPDPLALYSELCSDGKTPDTLLLESRDAVTKEAERSFIVPLCAVRAECRGLTVTFTGLTSGGIRALTTLEEWVGERADVSREENVLTATYPPPLSKASEQQRLDAPSPFDAIRALCLRWALRSRPSTPTLITPAVFSYDLLDCFEVLPTDQEDPLGFPDFVAWLPEVFLILDRKRRSTTIVALVVGGEGAEESYNDATDLIQRWTKMVETLRGPRTRAMLYSSYVSSLQQARRSRKTTAKPSNREEEFKVFVRGLLTLGAISRQVLDHALIPKALSDGLTEADARRLLLDVQAEETSGPQAERDLDDAAFAALVGELKERIVAGDVFQIVPSRTFSAPCPDPLSSYRTLRRLNPSPYMFYVRGSDHVLFGASPETAVKVSGTPPKVEIRPIAGTALRGKDANGRLDLDLDGRLEAELRLNEKELAEHMMLIDLARNDVARVSKSGTRHVPRLLTVDRYSHVMHLVSYVEGSLRDGLDALHAYSASMNMGTLVGAPKIKAAQILRQREATRRGPYGGSVGYLTNAGELDTAIVIRSAVVKANVAYVRAGAGVVYDSDPAAEARETTSKAAAVLKALGARP